MTMTLKTKLILILLPVFVIPFIVLGKFSYNHTIKIALKKEEIKIHVLLEKASQTIQSQSTTGQQEINHFPVLLNGLTHEKDNLLIVNQQGKVLYQSTTNRETIDAQFMAALLNQFHEHSQKNELLEIPHNQHVFYFKGLQLNNHLYLFALFPESEISVAGQSLLTWFAIVTLASLVIILVLLHFALNYLVINPIQALTKATHVINTHHLDIQLPHHWTDEIGLLYRDFSQMAKRLQAGLQEIECEYANLEETVRVRTLSLQKVNEELKIQRQKADAANKAKSEFVANISHELRTPMNGILGMAQLILNTPLSEKQYQQLNVLYDSARILLDIINELLDLSKIEAGKMELDTRAFNLLQTIEDAIALLRIKAQEKDLTLEIQADEHIPLKVMGDDNRLRQIIINLVGNAIKFTQEGGVTLKITPEQSVNPHEAQLRFAVIDTGIGIPKEALPYLFNKFHQVDASTSRRYEGTGLGLFICHQLIELMGGQIGVETEEGKGCTFWFTLTLPIAEQPVSPEEKSDSSPPIPQNIPQILLVEDDKINQIVGKMTLETLGCQLEVANNGEEAVEMTANQYYDLVLMDVHMPVLDGYEATQAIRQREQETNIHQPIIAMTADIISGDLDTYLETGMDDALAKPIVKASLEQILKKWFYDKHVTTASKPISKPQSLNILLVEDNDTNQIVEKMMLEEMGYQVNIANNGQQAIDLIAKENYDLVLMDIHMPVLDGCQATEQIRIQEQNTNTHLPIIAITASPTLEDIDKCKAAGMDDFLAKPIVQTSLEKMLQTWLN
jgi:signal transduction histidine kinase/DNA-binding response OmpR family regulator